MSEIIIHTEPLSRSAFAPFGDVIETDSVKPELINKANTQKFADLAAISTGNGGRAQVSIYRSHAVSLPFSIRVMERHTLGSQMFYPLHNRPFPIIVAETDCTPGPDTIRAFLSNGRQGINIHPGVWHHYQLTLEADSDYLVVDRLGSTIDCYEYHIKHNIILHI